MAQISYEDVKANENEYSVGFFSIKNDGGEALVRILCDQLSDLDILTVHPVTVGQSAFPNREVSCLRTPTEPLEKCPFCNAGEKVKQRVYIKMLQYDPQTHKPSAVVWNRPAGQYVPKLKSYIDNYGPLSQIMCKIVRHGSGLDTTYDIIPNLNPQQYTLDAYKLDVSDFEDFQVLGRMVMDKTADEMIAYQRTGQFPEKPKDDAPVAQPIPGGYNQYQTPANQDVWTAPATPAPNSDWMNQAQSTGNPPQMQTYQTTTAQMATSPLNAEPPAQDPWGNPMPGSPALNFGDPGMGRPQRY